jgi:hypothetical protein
MVSRREREGRRYWKIRLRNAGPENEQAKEHKVPALANYQKIEHDHRKSTSEYVPTYLQLKTSAAASVHTQAIARRSSCCLTWRSGQRGGGGRGVGRAVAAGRGSSRAFQH